MAKLLYQAPKVEVLRENINVFEDLVYDVSVQNTTTSVYYPQHSVESRNTPIVFEVGGTDVHYVDVGGIKLYLRGKIVNDDGTDIKSSTDKAVSTYALANNSLHSLIKSATVHIQETEITPKTGFYAYRSIFDTELGKGKDYCKSLAQAAGYQRTKDEESVTDEGWVTRAEEVEASATFELIGRPHLDILHQTKYLLPGLNLRISFTRAEDSFCIQTAGTTPPQNLQVKILEAKLYVPKHIILPSEQLKQLKMWEKEPIRYPMREVQMKSYTLPTGTLSHNNQSLITSLLPDRIVIALVDSNNLHGRYGLNPFLFKDFGLTNISVTCNSDVVSMQELEIDFADKRYIRAYNQVFEGLGITDCDSGVALTKSEFLKSKTFFVFDLRHLRAAPAPPRYGNCVINLRFKAATTHAINVMCYLEYPSCLNIDSGKNVWFTDYSNN